MYEAFFGLNRRPFPSTPDIAGYCPSSVHEEALALLRCCVDDGDGVGVLIGPPGTGKTLLCHLLMESLAENNSTVLLTNTHLSSISSMLQAILFDLSLPYEGKSEQELRLLLTDFLISRFVEGSRTLLFIDEAHHLGDGHLEELRMLTNLEGRNNKAVQVLLFAQPSIAETLEQPELESFRQRISVAARLRAFDAQQTMEYVRNAIEKVGGDADSIFTANAFSEICDRSRGIPRRINQLCHRSLLMAYANESGTVDATFVEAAADQLVLPAVDYSSQDETDDPGAEAAAESPISSEPEISQQPSVFEVGAVPTSKVEPEADEPVPDSDAAVAQSDATKEAPTPGPPGGAASRMHRLLARSA